MSKKLERTLRIVNINRQVFRVHRAFPYELIRDESGSACPCPSLLEGRNRLKDSFSVCSGCVFLLKSAEIFEFIRFIKKYGGGLGTTDNHRRDIYGKNSERNNK